METGGIDDNETTGDEEFIASAGSSATHCLVLDPALIWLWTTSVNRRGKMSFARFSAKKYGKATLPLPLVDRLPPRQLFRPHFFPQRPPSRLGFGGCFTGASFLISSSHGQPCLAPVEFSVFGKPQEFSKKRPGRCFAGLNRKKFRQMIFE